VVAVEQVQLKRLTLLWWEYTGDTLGLVGYLWESVAFCLDFALGLTLVKDQGIPILI
jgi:hypothetical protein